MKFNRSNKLLTEVTGLAYCDLQGHVNLGGFLCIVKSHAFNLPELTITRAFTDNVQAYHKLSISFMNKVMIHFTAHTASRLSSSHRYKS